MRKKIAKLFWPISAPLAFIQNHFKATLLVVIVLSLMMSNQTELAPNNNLHKMHLNGPIFDSSAFLEEIEKASKSHVKGLLVSINSPGGLVPPSVEMMMALQELAQSKPVVVYAAGTLASGSYYASLGADYIIANPGSMVGSIGVIFQTMNVSALMEKVGVQPRVVKSGAYKEVGAMYREWEPHEKAALKKLSTDTYNMFLNDVIKSRKLENEDPSKFANGRIFLASEALSLGLIDAVGNVSSAEAKIIELSGVNSPIWNEKSDLEKLMVQLSREASLGLTSVIENGLSTLTMYRQY
jgi:protease-4